MTKEELKLIEDAAESNHVSDEATRALYKLIDERERLRAALTKCVGVFTGPEYGGAPGTTDALAAARAALAGEEGKTDVIR